MRNFKNNNRNNRNKNNQPPKQRVCFFCVDKIKEIDYKDADNLKKFMSQQGKISVRKRTGTCAKHQRDLAIAIKRARFMGLVPYTTR